MQLSKRVSKHFGSWGETQMKVGGLLVSAVSARRVRITCSNRRVSRNGVPERIVRLGKAATGYAAVSGSAESAHQRVQARLGEIPRTMPSPLRITDWLGRAWDGCPGNPRISAHLVGIVRLYCPDPDLGTATCAFSDRAAFEQEPGVDQCPRKDVLIEAALWFIGRISLPVSLPIQYTWVQDNAVASQNLHQLDNWVTLLQPVGPLNH